MILSWFTHDSTTSLDPSVLRGPPAGTDPAAMAYAFYKEMSDVLDWFNLMGYHFNEGAA
jgi:hypothetical protein